MKFSSTLARLMWRGGFAAAVTALALVACGGGTDVEDFKPTRIVSFGDEASVIVAEAASSASQPFQGRKYTVNAFEVATSASAPPLTTLDCRRNPVWIQSVGAAFGLEFEACHTPGGNSSGLTYASEGATVAEVATQVAAFLDQRRRPDGTALATAAGDKDIVTLMAGQHDLVEIFLDPALASTDAKLARVRERANALAAQANKLAVAGPAVIVMRIPNLGYTPWGRAQGTQNMEVLRNMTDTFNATLQLGLINDGHLLGLAFGDIEVRNMVEFPSAFGLANTVAPVCAQAASAPAAAGSAPTDTPAIIDCTTATVIRETSGNPPPANPPAAVPATYLWAGNLALGPLAHSRLGALAANRALSNPF